MTSNDAKSTVDDDYDDDRRSASTTLRVRTDNDVISCSSDDNKVKVELVDCGATVTSYGAVWSRTTPPPPPPPPPPPVYAFRTWVRQTVSGDEEGGGGSTGEGGGGRGGRYLTARKGGIKGGIESCNRPMSGATNCVVHYFDHYPQLQQ